MQVLIIGLKERNAGKTCLALALLEYLREKGFNACGFKPYAGNNIWYDFDIIHKALSEGRLYGKDALSLKNASFPKQKEEIINPIHRLWDEPPVMDPISQFPNFIVDRIYDEEKNILIVNANKQYNFEKLYEKSRIIFVNELSSLNKVIEKYYEKSIKKAYKKIIKNYEHIVIESYADIAIPFEADIVMAIKPWKIFVYDGKDYKKAMQISYSIFSKEVPATKLVELLKPLEEIDIYPYKRKEIVQKLKEKIKASSIIPQIFS